MAAYRILAEQSVRALSAQFAAGSGKAPAIARAQAGDLSPLVALAVQAIEDSGGQVTWLLDKKAAQNL